MSRSTSCNTSPKTNISPLNKKRRFVHNHVAVAQESSAHRFNIPLVVHSCDQKTSESDVETQLFQVGMRVRKSVNDGYQTTSKQPSYSPVTDYSVETGGPQSFAGPFSYKTPERAWRYSTTNKRAFKRETEEDSDPDQSPMTPVMLHSDLRVQIPSSFFDINYDFDHIEDEMNSTAVLQDSPSQKGVLGTKVNGRRIAMPKSQRQKQKRESQGWNIFEELEDIPLDKSKVDRYQSSATQWWGHDRTVTKRIVQANDFEEANFLQSREDVEMDCS